MKQDTHFVPLEVVLPQIDNDHDQCVMRLTELLEGEPHLERVHMKHHANTTGLCVHYNPDVLSLDQVKSLVALSGARISDQFIHTTLRIEGMDCADCTNIIEHALGHLDGVLSANVGYASQQLRVEYNTQKISLKTIVKQLKKMGYSIAREKHPSDWWHETGELIMSGFAGVFLLAGWICSLYYPSLSFPAYFLSFATGGLLTFRDSVQTLLQKRFDIDVLMVFAAVGAIVLGEWADGALLLFLFSLGHALEHKAMHHAQHAVQALSKLAPKSALVVRDGQEITLPVEDLQLNDHVVVKPGQSFPIDGQVIEGTSSVDQSPITGESIPVDKSDGDGVFAGSINGQGRLVVNVTKLSADSTLSRMARLVMEADTQKSPTQRFTDKFVKLFVPIVILGVLCLIFIPPLFGFPWTESFYRAMAMLVAASPCALAISTPAAVLSGVARAAQHGVLIKGGAHLENLGNIRAIAFDKTGTLTQGKPRVQSIIALNGDEDRLLSLAASVEQYSHHPLATAIVNAADERQLPRMTVTDVQQITGKGITATLDGQTLEVGALRLFDNTSEEIDQHADTLLNAGQTLMVIRLNNQWLGLIGLADNIRPEVASAIQKLHQQGMRDTIMLTGDNQRVAEAIAAQIGIDQVHANLMPEDKLALISQLEAQFEQIAMVGDGINDAPALARATVGIAMGGAGTDVALEASDVSLMADDLSQLPFAIRLSRRAARVIKFNLLFALGVVVLLLILTATGYAGIGPAIIAHEGSTLLVVANALRLLKAK